MSSTFTREISKTRLDQQHDIRNVHGAPSWFELSTSDPAAACEYLSSVLGWEFDTIELGGSDYRVIKVNGHEVGGVRTPLPGAPAGPAWITYVTVEDADAIASRAKDAGGTIAIPPTGIPGVGTMVAVQHPDAGQLFGFEYIRPFE